MPKVAKMVTCKHCGNEIAASAKACPKCGGKNKKPIYKRGWFIALVVIIVLGAFGSVGNSESDSSTDPNNTSSVSANTNTTSSKTDAAATEKPIEYTSYSVSALMNDLDENPLKASDTYKDQYATLSGRLEVIDSSGKYISIFSTDDEWAIVGVQCYIKNDEQKASVMEMSIGDTIVVSGKITAVGEILGYSMDIDHFG